MKKIVFAVTAFLLFLSAGAFAEDHAYAAIEHTSAAIAQGKAGKAPDLVKHAEMALAEAKTAVDVAKGHSKTQIESAIKSLEEAISSGKTGDAKAATDASVKALGLLQSGNK